LALLKNGSNVVFDQKQASQNLGQEPFLITIDQYLGLLHSNFFCLLLFVLLNVSKLRVPVKITRKNTHKKNDRLL